jgi:hypothetical protein
MDDNTQSILLERYLLALQADSSAPPPPDLDPELAKMAQRLVSYSHIKARSSAKKRVWKDVMTQFEETSQKSNQKEKTRMLATKALPAKKSSSMSLMWIAVVSLIFVLGLTITIMMNNRPNPLQFASGIELGQGTATFIPEQIEASPTMITNSPPAGYVPVVTLYVAIFWGDTIRADMLTITYWEASRVPTGAFSRIEDVVGMISTGDAPRFLPLTDYMVIDGTLAMTGIPNIENRMNIPTEQFIVPIMPTAAFIPPLEITATPLLLEATPTFTHTPHPIEASSTFIPSATFTPTPRP